MMPGRTREQAVDAFNARFQAGDTIHVWTGPIEGAPKARTVRAPGAVVLSGHTAVVYVDGGGGCIALTHVQELGARPSDHAKIQRLFAGGGLDGV